MNKRLLLIFVLIISLFSTLNVQAWNSQGHQKLVENVYYSMPSSLQEKLNLTLMKEGAVAPDLVFHDTVLHHFPPSRDLAYKWLNNITSLSDFSYNFGVAAHYISDSFVAPHNVQKEDPALHSKFEKQVNSYAVKTGCANYNFTLNDLEIAVKNAADWDIWLNSQDPAIPQKEFEQAQKFIYSIAIQKLGYECNSQLIYEEKSILPNIKIPQKEFSYPVLLAILIISLIYKFFKKKRKLIAATLLLLTLYLVYKFLL